MTDDDGDSRRRRLQELRARRGESNDAAAGAGDDDVRIDRARSQRRDGSDGSEAGDSRAGMARFPRLREVLEKRGKGSSGRQGGGRSAWGRDPDASKPDDRVMFARRLRDTPEAAESDDPVSRLQRLERRFERLQVELDKSVEELRHLKRSLTDQGDVPTDSGGS